MEPYYSLQGVKTSLLVAAQEDIMAGEKYMGEWEGGARQGSGCVVTGDGVYYQV